MASLAAKSYAFGTVNDWGGGRHRTAEGGPEQSAGNGPSRVESSYGRRQSTKR